MESWTGATARQTVPNATSQSPERILGSYLIPPFTELLRNVYLGHGSRALGGNHMSDERYKDKGAQTRINLSDNSKRVAPQHLKC